LPSLQLGAGPPWQAPPEQTSLVVHALPSVHATLLGVLMQPASALQESSVHGFESPQFGGGPPWQVPPEQVSPVVQALPSLHAAEFGVFTQPTAGLHESLVQGFASLQLGAAPPWHAPPEQVSPVVQALPSLHGCVFGWLMQPEDGSHESLVQGFVSLQFGAGPPTQAPPAQVSLVVQALPSLHGFALAAWVQPDAGLHESVVHGFESSQLGGGPPTHAPPAHVSPVVQALPSLHGDVLLTWVQPVAGAQPSVVHGFESLQLGAGPPWQVPPELVSAVVQALPSLHDAALGV
jgi:hypothetical protein